MEGLAIDSYNVHNQKYSEINFVKYNPNWFLPHLYLGKRRQCWILIQEHTILWSEILIPKC